MPYIYQYLDYRDYLRDSFAFKRKADSAFSLRRFGQSCRLTQAYISFVLQGKRSLSITAAIRVAKSLMLTKQQTYYFLKLRNLSDSVRPMDRQKTIKELQKTWNFKKTHPKEFETFKYYLRWYHVVLRELVEIPGFKDDPKWIRKQLIEKIPDFKIKAAMDFLLKSGFITKNAARRYKSTEKDVGCDGPSFRLALSEFHKKMGQLASDSIANEKYGRFKVSSYTAGMSKKTYLSICGKINELYDEIDVLVKQPQTRSEVFHFSIQGFPLTKFLEDSWEEKGQG